ncbi:TRAM, LAG1 and CLN8 lipid-sensing domain containing protein [Prunus dulcis]|uniref:TRAM, LAG1 and CLN8 lipid-sensing domain containing protein n=1 Tax=Prunus dulcis TaxID=3755 RepID=A0A4Y1RJI3_PRUDU|nr:TRAM, LAG1 and CLN8 lipid-sensing domain containing protein [Prunus dulcis]
MSINVIIKLAYNDFELLKRVIWLLNCPYYAQTHIGRTRTIKPTQYPQSSQLFTALEDFSFSLVYRLTRLISLLSFEGYHKLSKAQRVEWNNRGFSTVHAIAVAFSSFYLLLLSDTFHEDHRDELIISRRSTLSDTTLGISIGYFLADLGMIFWHFPALGGLEYVLHHALSMFSIFLSLVSGKGQIYILMVLFSESTTPFVNLRWYLDVAGQDNFPFGLLQLAPGASCVSSNESRLVLEDC